MKLFYMVSNNIIERLEAGAGAMTLKLERHKRFIAEIKIN